MFLQLRKAIGWTRDERTCDEQDVVQTKDLRDETGDLISDLKISSAGGNIYALEVHTNTFISSSSGLNALEKDTTL